MGQFTGLFNELETADKKAQPQMNTATNADKQPKPATHAPTTKPRQTANTKRKIEKPSSANAAPMRGKRSHPDYTQAPAFVRKATYKAVKIALLNSERGLDYSDLVEELLTLWLNNNK